MKQLWKLPLDKLRANGLNRRFLICILAAAAAIGLLEYFGAKQGRVCESLKPGLSQQDMSSALGTPINQYKVNEDILQLSFRGSIAAAGPIRAWVDQKTGRVIRLQCWEDAPNAWKIDQQLQ